jgi:hypothetical protein
MSHFKWVKKTIDWHCNVCLEEKYYAVGLFHDSATNVIIDDFISSKKLKSDSMADPLREIGEDSSLPYDFSFSFFSSSIYVYAPITI